MEGPRLIERVRLQNFLSFGPEGVDVELQPLNVLVGPNGSGKSNFLRAVDFLRRAPEGVDAFRQKHEVADDFIYKGEEDNTACRLGFRYRWHKPNASVVYNIELSDFIGDGSFTKDNEYLGVEADEQDPIAFYVKNGADRFVRVEIYTKSDDDRLIAGQVLQKSEDRNLILETILAKPDTRLHESYLFTRNLTRIFFLDGQVNGPPRASRSDDDQSFLTSDGSNLANVIESLQHRPLVMAKITEFFRHFYPNAVRIIPGLSGGKTALFVEEKGLVRTMPASRLSHGTIHFLCLATALLHPNPPPLICIEQPEDGLHPDVIPSLARMLIDAATRTQVIVTTHSAALVDALQEIPESILVCERGPNGTTMERLNPEQIRPWLEEYTLGDLWLSGRIGGTRF